MNDKWKLIDSHFGIEMNDKAPDIIEEANEKCRIYTRLIMITIPGAGVGVVLVLALIQGIIKTRQNVDPEHWYLAYKAMWEQRRKYSFALSGWTSSSLALSFHSSLLKYAVRSNDCMGLRCQYSASTTWRWHSTHFLFGKCIVLYQLLHLRRTILSHLAIVPRSSGQFAIARCIEKSCFIQTENDRIGQISFRTSRVSQLSSIVCHRHQSQCRSISSELLKTSRM